MLNLCQFLPKKICDIFDVLSDFNIILYNYYLGKENNYLFRIPISFYKHNILQLKLPPTPHENFEP